MVELKTADDWWAEWNEIAGDVKSYISNMHLSDLLDNPGVEVYEELYETLKDYKSKGYITIYQTLSKMAETRDHRLYHVLESIWADAPDSPSIHGWPSWGRFCDLCSEGGWILFPDRESANANSK